MIADHTRVRVATEGDRGGILEISRAVHEENGTGRFDEDRVAERLDKAFRGQNAVCGVIGPSERIEGAVLLELGQYWYSDDWHLTERFLCVLPEYRRSTNAKDLLAFSKHCAETMRVPLFCGVTTRNNIEAKTVFYRKALGPVSGVVWIFTPGTGAQ